MDDKTEKLKQHAAEAFGIKPEEITVFHASPTYGPCEHEWNDDEPEYCVKCGMSFTRYAFTECP